MNAVETTSVPIMLWKIHPIRDSARWGFSAVKQVIHPKRGPAEKPRPGNPPPNDVMAESIRMGKRTYSHAAGTIRPGGIPITVAGVRVKLPTVGAINFLNRAHRDGLTGAGLSTFLTDIAEINDCLIRLTFIRDQV